MIKIALTIVGILFIFVSFEFGNEIQKHVFPKPNYADLHDGKVILYSTSWCGYCERTRQFLNEENIPFYEYDIEKSIEGHEQYRTLGGRGVPVLLVNKSVIKGYSPDEILKYLN